MYAQFIGSIVNSPPAATTRYTTIEGVRNNWQTTAGTAQQVIPHDLTIDLFRMFITTGPGVGKNMVVTIQKNGVDTSITFTITGAGSNFITQDLTHSVSFAQGDLINIKCVTDSGSTPVGPMMWSLRQSASGQYAVLSGIGSASATRFGPIQGVGAPNASETTVLIPMAHDGSIKNLFVRTEVAPGTGNSWTVALSKNVAVSSLSCVVADTATTANNTGNTVLVSAGDRASTKCTATATPAAGMVFYSYTIVPSNDGDAMFSHSDQNSLVSGTKFQYGLGGNPNIAWSATESPVQQIIQACTFKNFFLRQNQGPGASWTVTVRVNAIDTTLSIVVSSGSASSQQNASVQQIAINDNDLLSISGVPTGTPGSFAPQTSILYSMSPNIPRMGFVDHANPGFA